MKESVFPFAKFPGADTLLGPEMRSTGEVMGIAAEFPEAFYKAAMGAGSPLPKKGAVFISVRDEDKPAAIEVARSLHAFGFELVATLGTATALRHADVPSAIVNKIREGRPHVVDLIHDGKVAMVINTTAGSRDVRDSYSLRRQTLVSGVPYHTTIAAALAAVTAIGAMQNRTVGVRTLQEYHADATRVASARMGRSPRGRDDDGD